MMTDSQLAKFAGTRGKTKAEFAERFNTDLSGAGKIVNAAVTQGVLRIGGTVETGRRGRPSQLYVKA